MERLAFAREILRREAEALHAASEQLTTTWHEAIELLLGCTGKILVTGVGKSDDIGRKIVGTLNSTGSRAYTLDAVRAVHGDLGMVHPSDVALVLSHRGESEELNRLLPSLRKLCSGIVAITSAPYSTVARWADIVISYGRIEEACPLKLAPSSSTTVMLALGDALAFTLSEARGFQPTDFARFHPAGSLGRQLADVVDYMRQGEELRIAAATDTVRAVFAQVRHTGRRTGAVILVNEHGQLVGLFTDSDLARLFERHDDNRFDGPIADVMTKQPITLPHTAKLGEAIELLRTKKISELPIVDDQNRPLGMLDVTDLVGVEVSPHANKPSFRVLPLPAVTNEPHEVKPTQGDPIPGKPAEAS